LILPLKNDNHDNGRKLGIKNLQHGWKYQKSPTFVLIIPSLQKTPYIRKVSALFFLALISLATTPKLILHNFFANHKDSAYHLNKSEHANLTSAVVNCHTQDLVVEAPFIDHSFAEFSTPYSTFELSSVETVHFLYSQTTFYFELRGPPAVA
jgi:hypothetical protein